MATTPEEVQSDSSGPEDPVLQPQLSQAWALTPLQLVLVALFCLFFVLLNYFPLRGTDLWAHVLWGQIILETKAIPETDPIQGLSEGMRVIDSAWLSQVLLAKIQSLGDATLSNTFALISLAGALLLARVCYLLTRDVFATTMCFVLYVTLGFSRLTTIRPENFAFLCFVTICWLLLPRLYAEHESDRRITLAAWIGSPILFWLWANIHGSFVVGILILACFAIGECVEAAIRERSVLAPFRNPLARRLIFFTELCLIVTLLNPYGSDLWIFVAQFRSMTNILDIQEWQPLVLHGVGGIEFAASCAIAVIVIRRTRLPVRVSHLLALGCFAYLAASHIRMLTWYPAVFVILLGPHLADVWSQIRDYFTIDRTDSESLPSAPAPASSDSTDGEGENEDEDDETDAEILWQLLTGRSFRITLIAGLLIWIAFALSPISLPILGGQVRTPEQLHGREAPLAVASYLATNTPKGQVFNPQYWGDLLRLHAPDLKVFSDSNVHLLPRRVWRDYLEVSTAAAGWSEVLERYRVTTVILDKATHEAVSSYLTNSPNWTVIYEDDVAIIFTAQVQTTPRTSTETKPDAQDVNEQASTHGAQNNGQPLEDESQPEFAAARNGRAS